MTVDANLPRKQQDAGVPGGDLRTIVSVTGFYAYEDAIAIAVDTLYGLGAGVWARDANLRYPGRGGGTSRPVGCGRTATTPTRAHAVRWFQVLRHPPGNHLMMLEHYQQTNNLLVSSDQNRAGFFF